MSRVPDKDVERSEATTREPVGRVVVDSRGHNVWQWARDVIESTSVLLKRLENNDLALEPTRKVPVVREEPAKAPKSKPAKKTAAQPPASRHPALPREGGHSRDGGGGFDPYNSR
jgi:hypothetical protein